MVLSIDVCRGLGISLLRTNSWLSFSQADLGPRSAQECFFSGFLKSSKLFFRRFVLIASGTEILWRVSLKFQLFMETSRFHRHRSYITPSFFSYLFLILVHFFRLSFLSLLPPSRNSDPGSHRAGSLFPPSHCGPCFCVFITRRLQPFLPWSTPETYRPFGCSS